MDGDNENGETKNNGEDSAPLTVPPWAIPGDVETPYNYFLSQYVQSLKSRDGGEWFNRTIGWYSDLVKYAFVLLGESILMEEVARLIKVRQLELNFTIPANPQISYSMPDANGIVTAKVNLYLIVTDYRVNPPTATARLSVTVTHLLKPTYYTYDTRVTDGFQP